MPTFSRPRPSMGTDPEVFVVDGNDDVVPASQLGVEDSSTDKNIVYDNVAAEIRPRATQCLEYVLPSMQGILKDLKKILDKDDRDLDISLSPARRIDPSVLRDNDGCMEFGCDPSQVYGKDGLRLSEPSVAPEETSIRSVGFHIHWGKNPPTDREREIWADDRIRKAEILHDVVEQVKVIELADIFLGLVGVMMEQEYDEMVRWRRKELGYGVAGEFRQQDHGLEYRTLGPWPMRHLTWTWWAFSTARDCYYLVVNDLHEEIVDGIPRDAVIDAINENDENAAINLWNMARENLVEAIDGYTSIRDGNQALVSLQNLRRLEFALATDKLETFFPDEGMWESWEGYNHHSGDCFPNRTGMVVGQQFRRFCGFWDPGQDNIRKWRSDVGKLQTIRVRNGLDVREETL